ncbi:hypothetical protein GCM10011369_20820 [Neiella marina]|uniref:Zinc ribbon-containing protein n=1 Tax=Neiella marina TaxID=508461 RepID=A0A8J2U5A6_9GAMM|nr:hypothetical protein [Neiella marina]GGA78721.1 hypothetical protein GCM10011369_20820 [Neiella marina]
MSNENNKDYETLIDKVLERLKHEQHLTADALDHWLERAAEYVGAASDLTKDELTLMRDYLKRDFQAFADSMDPDSKTHPPSVWLTGISQGIWHNLMEITDKTQCEWRELSDDLKHDGVYRRGEYVGFGVLRCCNCDHVLEVYHPTQLSSCANCGHDEFAREPFEP